VQYSLQNNFLLCTITYRRLLGTLEILLLKAQIKMKFGSLLAVLLTSACAASAADFGRYNLEKRQGWDVFGAAAEALGTFRSMEVTQGKRGTKTNRTQVAVLAKCQIPQEQLPEGSCLSRILQQYLGQRKLRSGVALIEFPTWVRSP
jgi:hypothetical protein